MRPFIFVVALIGVGAVTPASLAQAPKEAIPRIGIQSLLPPPQTTEHQIQIGARAVKYEARAGTVSLLAGDASVTANVFYVS
jgi:hypothetical protein